MTEKAGLPLDMAVFCLQSSVILRFSLYCSHLFSFSCIKSPVRGVIVINTLDTLETRNDIEIIDRLRRQHRPFLQAA